MARVICSNCKKEGHKHFECWYLQCHHCKGPGHQAAWCPEATCRLCGEGGHMPSVCKFGVKPSGGPSAADGGGTIPAWRSQKHKGNSELEWTEYNEIKKTWSPKQTQSQWPNWGSSGQDSWQESSWGASSQKGGRSSSAQKKKKVTWEDPSGPWESSDGGAWSAKGGWSGYDPSKWEDRSTAPSRQGFPAGGKPSPSVSQGAAAGDGDRPKPKWACKPSATMSQEDNWAKKKQLEAKRNSSSSITAMVPRQPRSHGGGVAGGDGGAVNKVYKNARAERSARRLMEKRGVKYSVAELALRETLEKTLGGCPQDTRECVAWARAMMNKTYVPVGVSKTRVAVATGMEYAEMETVDAFGTPVVDCSLEVALRGEIRLTKEEYLKQGGTTGAMTTLIQGIGNRLKELTSEDVETLREILCGDLVKGEALMTRQLVRPSCAFPKIGGGETAPPEQGEDSLGDSLASSVSVAQPKWKKSRFAADKVVEPDEIVVKAMRKALYQLKRFPLFSCKVRAKIGGLTHMKLGELRTLGETSGTSLELTWYGGPSFNGEDTWKLTWSNSEKPNGDPARFTKMRSGIEDVVLEEQHVVGEGDMLAMLPRAENEVDYFMRGVVSQRPVNEDWAPMKYMEMPMNVAWSIESWRELLDEGLTFAGGIKAESLGEFGSKYKHAGQAWMVENDLQTVVASSMTTRLGRLRGELMNAFSIESMSLNNPKAGSTKAQTLDLGLRCCVCGALRWHTLSQELNVEVSDRNWREQLSIPLIMQMAHEETEEVAKSEYSMVALVNRLLEDLSSERHRKHASAYANGLTACMGVLEGRGARWASRGIVAKASYLEHAGERIPIGAAECAFVPTVEELMRTVGDLRGGAALLTKSLIANKCRYWDERRGTAVQIAADDVTAIVPMMIYWDSSQVNTKYNKALKLLPVSGMYKTTNEYYEAVIGKVPTESDGAPHRTLVEYMLYEAAEQKRPAPKSYKPLEEKKKLWSKKEQDEYKDWPSKAHLGLTARMPPSDGTLSWWPVYQVVPREGSKLSMQIGTQWVLYCVHQIMYPQNNQDNSEREWLEGWINQYQSMELTSQFEAYIEQVENEMAATDGMSTTEGTTVESDTTGLWDDQDYEDVDEASAILNDPDTQDGEDYLGFY